MSKNDSLNHAIHNKEACEYLSKEPKFSDWVITTAFYSALHFIDYKIFPLDLKLSKYPVNFTTFNGYYDFYSKNKEGKINQHKARADLVESLFPIIAPQFNKLKDLCHNARYVNYKFDYDIAKNAKQCLEKIEKFCTANNLKKY
ncbi:MAG: hypothetical protein MRK02_02960 [Candidatus Scalindua sp.]|nr:hypothetical protein [Candidatus Scalindua sp.]